MAKTITIKEAYARALMIMGVFAVAGGFLALSGLAGAPTPTDQNGSVPISQLGLDEFNQAVISLDKNLVYCVPEPITMSAGGELRITDDGIVNHNCYRVITNSNISVRFDNVSPTSSQSLLIK